MADSPARRPLHFLLVEDDDDHADLVLRSLRDERIRNTMDRVADGRSAMSYIRREGHFVDRQLPDVVLLDLKLPEMDGHEVLAALKDDEDLRLIPVIVLTTSGAEADRARAYMHGANSYVVKPLGFDAFRRMVQDLQFYWTIWNEPALD